MMKMKSSKGWIIRRFCAFSRYRRRCEGRNRVDPRRITEFDHAAFLAGSQTPVFFGSAINNFGVREVLDTFVEFAPPPGARNAFQRRVQPGKPGFSGVVFKIQANMKSGTRATALHLSGSARAGSARYESENRAQRQGYSDKRGSILSFPAARLARYRLSRRHHRNPQPRHPATGRYPD